MFSFKSSSLDSDPLSISCANIISIVRNVEAQLMLAIGLQKKSSVEDGQGSSRVVRGYEDYILHTSSAAPRDGGAHARRKGSSLLSAENSSLHVLDAPVVTEDLVDEFVRHRIASLTATIVRQAEENIAEELTRITQLVPLSKEGGTYARAPLISSPPPPTYSPAKLSPVPETTFSPARTAPGSSRPTAPRDAAVPPRVGASTEGTERLQALMDLVRSPRVSSPTRRDDLQEAHAVRLTGNYFEKPQVNGEHKRRMVALQQLADKFAKPNPLSQYTPPAPRGDMGSFHGNFDFSSSRARQYAEQLSNLVEAAGDETASLSSSGFADVRPAWRGTN